MVDKSEKFEWLVRLGYAARGMVYILIGYLFLTGGSGGGSGDGGPQSAFGWVRDVPGGTIVLYLSAIGLLAYALYRLASAFLNVEHYGHDARGAANRVGHGASGIAHLVLSYSAFQIANGGPQQTGGASRAANGILSIPLGSLVLGIVGVGFVLAALMQAKGAYTGSFMRRVSGQAPSYVKPLGRAGYAARAVVFAVIGWSLMQSAWFSTDQVKTFGEAIASLRDDGLWFKLVALGILLFGVFSLFLAKYRIIPDIEANGLKPHLR